MIRVSAFYPYEDGAKFDFDYYSTRHFPMIASLLQAYGFIRFEIDRGLFSPGRDKPEFIAIGHFFAEDLKKLNEGLALHRTEILSDVQNYTNLSPRVQYSEIV